MENSNISIFINAFFSLFKAYVKEYRIDDGKTLGIIGWQEDDDEQSFSWIIDLDDHVMLKIKLLCDFLVQHNLIRGDKIIVSTSELATLLCNNGWAKNEAETTIDKLCSVRFKMIDDMGETDSFLVHF